MNLRYCSKFFFFQNITKVLKTAYSACDAGMKNDAWCSNTECKIGVGSNEYFQKEGSNSFAKESS